MRAHGLDSIQSTTEELTVGGDAVSNLDPNRGKNVLVNGTFNISQRGTSFGSSGTYTADRWYLSHNASSVSINKSIATAYPVYGRGIVRMNLTTKGGSFTDFALLQGVESLNSYQFVGKQATFSVWLRKNSTFSSGSAQINIYTGTGYDETIPSTGRVNYSETIAASELGLTFQRYSITADIPTGVTQLGVVVRMLSSPPDGSYMDVAMAQLEIGDTASEYVERSFEEELAMCQRYYEKSYNVGNNPGTTTSTGIAILSSLTPSTTTRLALYSVRFHVKKRNTPTISVWDQNGNSGQINKYNSSGVTLTVSSIANEGQSDVGIYVNTSSGADAEAYVCHWAAESEL